MNEILAQIERSTAGRAERDVPQQAKGSVAKLTVPAEKFVLYETLNALPEAEFSCKKTVNSGTESVLPLVRVRGATRSELEPAFESDPSVRDSVLLAEFEDTMLYRMEWNEEIQLLVEIITNAQNTILDMSTSGHDWLLRVLYPSRAALSNALSFYERRNLAHTVDSIHEFDGEPGGRYGLSSKQFEALSTAYEYGYFQIPREMKLEDIADELGISHQAFSERLRRAHMALVENLLLVNPREEQSK